MSRVDLRCRCGYLFFVLEEKLRSGAPINCPLCGQPVGVEGPVDAPRRPSAIAPPMPPDPRKKLIVLGMAVCGVLVLAIVAVLFMSGGQEEPRRAAAPAPPKSAVKIWIDEPPPAARESSPASPTPPNPGPAVAAKPFSPAAGPRPSKPADAEVKPRPAAAPAEPPPQAAPSGTQIPGDVLLAVREMLLSLAPYYRDLCIAPQDRARVETLVAAGRGGAQDIQFLKDLCVSDKVRVIRDEIALIAESLRKLEKEAVEGLPVDRVALHDGRTLLGRVVAESPDDVRIERRMAGGVTGMMNVKRVDIKSLEKGRGPGVEFKTRWAAAQKGSAADQIGLLAWCKESQLTLQAKLLSFTILTSDPSHLLARAEAELPANPVQRALDAAAQGGLVQYQGRNWTARELKDKLIRDGMALMNGDWYVRKERTISVPGLFRYDRQDDKPVAFSALNGGGVCHDTETVYAMVQDLASNSFVEKADVKFLRRFYACPLTVVTKSGSPSGAAPVTAKQWFTLSSSTDVPEPLPGKVLTGDIVMNIPVNQPILEASVKTLAEVKPGASITVYLLHEGQRLKLYSCAPKEDDLHKLPDVVRGKQSVDLVAVISMPAAYTTKTERRVIRLPKKNDKGVIIAEGQEVVHYRQIPDYKATLFPSTSNTLEVFRLKVTVGEPAPALNDLFQKAGAADVLRQ